MLARHLGEQQGTGDPVEPDAARLFRPALEEDCTNGPYHAAAEEGVPFRTIAEATGRGLGVPAVAVSPDAAASHFGWFSMFAGADLAASSERTRTRLGWSPSEPGLIADIENAGYFG